MTNPEHDVTDDLAALQQLPEPDRAPDELDPTCATTGVTTSTPNSEPPSPDRPDRPAPDSEPERGD
jgi:hypothetical protein